MRRLTEIANACKTDKGTSHGLAHGYTSVYELLLSHRRLEPLRILEVGLLIGEPETFRNRSVADMPSVRMWREYFPNAQIYGLDISDFSSFQTPWFTFYQADCGNEVDLDAVAARDVSYDVIVDDGSHASYHQQLTLLSLFRTLKPGGLFFIEDLNWVPTEYERCLPKVPRTRHLLSTFASTGVFADTGDIASSRWTSLADEIANVLLVDESNLRAPSERFSSENALATAGPTRRPNSGGTTLLGRLRAGLLAGLNASRQRPVGGRTAKLAVLQRRW